MTLICMKMKLHAELIFRDMKDFALTLVLKQRYNARELENGLFRPQGFLKVADDRTGNVRDVCFEVLCQSMDNFCVVID